MRKQFLFIIAILLVSFTVTAQTTKSKTTQQKAKPVAKKTTIKTKQSSTIGSTGWSAEEKTVFLDACIKEMNWSKDSSAMYCSCMLSKIEKLYPTAIASEKMTQEKALELAKECLTGGEPSRWTAKERTEFATQCEATASKSLGADKAKSYCSCMLVKIEKQFPNPVDVAEMTQETVSRWAEECRKQ
jgi:hypothetical protein